MAETTGPGAAPRALIVTIYGLYGRDSGGWLSVSLMIRLLAELGVDEPAVRSAISRLKRRGLLAASRRDGAAGYALSAEAQEILAEGDAQIFQPHPARLADGWLLVVFSVPETERAKRHTLRSRLAALGFGAAAPGVWVAPAHRRDLTASTLRRLGLEPYVDLFRADYLAFTDLTRAVREWWDLSAIHKSYVEFIARWEGLGRQGSSAESFADWVRLLTDWRRLPYLDPGLPPELLPADWPGAQATELFHRLRARLASPAHDHVRRVSAPLAASAGR